MGGGPILDHASLKIYGAKPSGQISSNQNGYCPLIHLYVFYFVEPLMKIKLTPRKNVFSNVVLDIFSNCRN